MTQDFTGTFDDIQEALEAQMRHKGDHVDKALTRLKALRETIPKDLDVSVLDYERQNMSRDEELLEASTKAIKAAALLASADRSYRDGR